MSDTLKDVYHILKESSSTLRTDLQVKNIDVVDDEIYNVNGLLTGRYVASDVMKHVSNICKKVIIEMFIPSVGTEIILETYWTLEDVNDYTIQLGKIIEETYHTLKIFDKLFDRRRRKIYVVLFMLNIEKCYPTKSIKNNVPFNANNVNSGYSYIKNYIDDSVDIVIYRKEELLKVLKHEMLHVMGVHLHTYPKEYDDYLKNTYNITSEQNGGTLNIFEGYVEFIALFLNTFIYSYCKTFTTDDGISREFYKELNENMEIEKNNTLRIVKKLLKDREAILNKKMNEKNKEIMGWEFKKAFKENTNVFSYQIIKWILLSNWKNTLLRIKRISPTFTLDNHETFHEYFKLVKDNLPKLDIINILDSPLKDTRKMRMSFHTRL